MRIILAIASLFLVNGNSYGQYIVTTPEHIDREVQLEELLNLLIENQSNKSGAVYLKFIFQGVDAAQEVSFTTYPLTILPSSGKYQFKLQEVIKRCDTFVAIEDGAISFKGADFILCIEAYGLGNDLLLQNTCKQYQVREQKNTGLTKYIEEGSFSIDHYLGSPGFIHENPPEGLIAAQGNTSLNVLNVPLDVGFQYTNDPFYPQKFQYSFSFDRGQMTAKLKNQLEQQLQKQVDSVASQAKDYFRFKNELEIYQSFLNDEKLTGQFAQLDQLDSLGQVQDGLKEKLNDVGPFDSIPQSDSLYDSKYLHYKDSVSKRLEQINKAVDKLNELKKKKEKYDEIQTKANQVQGHMDSLDVEKAINEKERLEEELMELQDPYRVEEKLEGHNLYTGATKYLNYLEELKFGRYSPYYNELVLSGAQINGIRTGARFKDLALTVDYGKQLPAFLNIDTTNNRSSTTDVIAAKLEYEPFDGQRLEIYYLDFDNTEQDSFQNEGVYTNYLRPDKNKVIGSSIYLTVLKNLTVQGFGGVSNSQYNSGLLPHSDNSHEVLGGWFFGKNAKNGITDYALSADASLRLFKNRTLLEYRYEKVGEHYHSLGAPYIPHGTDNMEAKLSQVISNVFSLGLFYENSTRKRFLLNKIYTQKTNRFGISMEMDKEDWPRVIVKYMPSVIKGGAFNFKNATLNANLLYTKRRSGLLFTTMLNGFWQLGNYTVHSDTFYNEGNSITLQQTVMLMNKYSISLSSGLSAFDSKDIPVKRYLRSSATVQVRLGQFIVGGGGNHSLLFEEEKNEWGLHINAAYNHKFATVYMRFLHYSMANNYFDDEYSLNSGIRIFF